MNREKWASLPSFYTPLPRLRYFLFFWSFYFHRGEAGVDVLFVCVHYLEVVLAGVWVGVS